MSKNIQSDEVNQSFQQTSLMDVCVRLFFKNGRKKFGYLIQSTADELGDVTQFWFLPYANVNTYLQTQNKNCLELIAWQTILEVDHLQK